MGPNGGSGTRILRDCLEARVRELLTLNPTLPLSLKQSATTRFVASSLTTVIECWIEKGTRETPQQVQSLFSGLVSPGLQEMRSN